MSTIINEKLLLRALGDGLILRRATPEDAQALADFNTDIHRDEETDQTDGRVGAWTIDLLSGSHPTVDPSETTIVEDTRTGRIVSSICPIPQTWSYGGIPIRVCRPELVGTLSDYRNRGLVRVQFDFIHERSAQRGDDLQAITGIPYYYRQFGYEMALDLDSGRMGYPINVPETNDDRSEPFRTRPAGAGDIGFLTELYAHGCRRYLVHSVFDEVMWRYELDGRRDDDICRLELRIVESLDGSPVGFLAHPPFNWSHGASLWAFVYEVIPGLSWAAVTPSVIRYLAATGKEQSLRQGKKEFGAFGFWLGRQHPVYEVSKDCTPRFREPYAWYLRVANLPVFIQRIKPVIEDRLSRSPLAGFDGELKLTFYRDGLKLTFVSGQLSSVNTWKPEPQGHTGEAGFPDLTFLQLLFGYRSLDELEYAFPDCWCNKDDVRGLLNAIFPKQNSHVLPIA